MKHNLKVGAIVFDREDASYYGKIVAMNRKYIWVTWYGGYSIQKTYKCVHKELFYYGCELISDEKEILQFLIKNG